MASGSSSASSSPLHPDRVQPSLQLLEPAPLGAEQQLAQLGQLLRGGVGRPLGERGFPRCPIVGHRRQLRGPFFPDAGAGAPPTRAASSESRLESEALSVLVVLSS